MTARARAGDVVRGRERLAVAEFEIPTGTMYPPDSHPRPRSIGQGRLPGDLNR
jgi:hypothetical protein